MKKILALTLSLFAMTALAKDGPTSEFQNWMSINNNVYLTDKVRAFLEVSPRLTDNQSNLSTGILRPAIGYDLNENWTVWAGYVMLATNKPTDNNYNFEHQSYQQLTYRTKIGNTSYELRNAVEERYLPSDVGFRTRNRLRAEYVFPNQTTWSVVGYDEIFMNFNDVAASNVRSGAAQNRAYVGIGYRFNSHIQLETGYMNQYVWNKGDVLDQSNNVWSSALNLNF